MEMSIKPKGNEVNEQTKDAPTTNDRKGILVYK
jgi:hypothetical protein